MHILATRASDIFGRYSKAEWQSAFSSSRIASVPQETFLPSTENTRLPKLDDDSIVSLITKGIIHTDFFALTLAHSRGNGLNELDLELAFTLFNLTDFGVLGSLDVLVPIFYVNSCIGLLSAPMGLPISEDTLFAQIGFGFDHAIDIFSKESAVKIAGRTSELLTKSLIYKRRSLMRQKPLPAINATRGNDFATIYAYLLNVANRVIGGATTMQSLEINLTANPLLRLFLRRGDIKHSREARTSPYVILAETPQNISSIRYTYIPS